MFSKQFFWRGIRQMPSELTLSAAGCCSVCSFCTSTTFGTLQASSPPLRSGVPNSLFSSISAILLKSRSFFNSCRLPAGCSFVFICSACSLPSSLMDATALSGDGNKCSNGGCCCCGSAICPCCCTDTGFSWPKKPVSVLYIEEKYGPSPMYIKK